MRTRSISEVRDQLAETVDEVHYTGERVLLEKHGKAVAALVSTQDLELLEALEDRADHERIREALAESTDRIPYDELRAELGLG